MAGWREELPASLQEILQNGLLEHAFNDALVGSFIYDQLAEVRPWGGQLGSTSIMTRSGLITPTIAAITGSDAGVQTYGFEQYQVQMNQYGSSIDTNMSMSAMALASKFLQDAKTLAISAAQSLDQLAQNQLYTTFGGGQTFVTAASGATGAFVPVQDITGFAQTIVSVAGTGAGSGEGLSIGAVNTATGVSSSYPGYVSLNGGSGVAYTGVTASGAAVTQNGQIIQPGFITLSSAAASGSVSAYDSVIAVAGSSSYVPVNSFFVRPGNATSQSALTPSNVATLAVFRNAITRLKSQHVPQRNGAYTSYIHPETTAELFADTEFQSAYRGRGEDEIYREGVLGQNADATYLGRLAGIDWVENSYTPTVPFGNGASGNTVYRDLVVGQEPLIKAPFEDMGNLLGTLSAGATVHVTMKEGIVYILRLPLDRLGQVVSNTWSWTGGYSTGTDVLTGDQSIYKRGVVVEHS